MFYGVNSNLRVNFVVCVIFNLAFVSANYGQQWQLIDPALPRSVPQYQGPTSGYPLDETSSSIKMSPGPSNGHQNPNDRIQQPGIDNRSVDVSPKGSGLPSDRFPTFIQDDEVAPDYSSLNADSSDVSSPPEMMPGFTSNNAAPSRLNGQNQGSVATHGGGIDYSIYRDFQAYPVDPRKPVNPCTNPTCGQPKLGHSWPGRRGQSYQESEPGGCPCSKVYSKKRDHFSVNWPAPFSAIREKINPSGYEARRISNSRINNLFDPLVDFKLIPFQRTDNGYFGPGADIYGCLGESRARVAGLGFRQPGEPVAPANVPNIR